MIPCFLHPGKYCEKYLSHKQDPPFHLFPKTIIFYESKWGIICMPINIFHDRKFNLSKTHLCNIWNSTQS